MTYIPTSKMEFVNRVGREKGGVCIYVTNKVKYKTRKKIFVLQIQIMNHVLLKLKGKMPRIF